MKTAFLTYHTNNIGDDIQTVAARELFGEPDVYVDRDYVCRDILPRPVNLIANGLLLKGSFPPTFNTHLKCLSVALGGGGPKNRDDVIDTLKGKVVGSRDRETVKYCEKIGAKGIFVGCLTMQLQRSTVFSKDDPVRFFDVDPAAYRMEYPQAGYYCNKCNAFRSLTDAATRQKVAKAQLELIECSSLVVTNKIHVAMPAIAYGVPLVFVDTDIPARFRLTALPEDVKLHKPNEDFEPKVYDATEFRRHQIQTIQKVMEQLVYLERKNLF